MSETLLSPPRRRWLLALALATPLIAGLALPAHAGDESKGEAQSPADDERHVQVYAFKLDGSSFLGVQPTELTPELRRHLGAPEDVGVLIAKIVEDSPAAEAGLAVGDILTGVDGEPVRRPLDLRRAVGRHESGKAVPVEVWRGGKRLELSVTLAERKAATWTTGGELERLPEIHLGEMLDPEHFEFTFDPENFKVEGLDPEAFEHLGEELRRMFESEEWQDTLRRFDDQRGDMGDRLRELEERLHQLESQLEDLEDQDQP